MLTKALQRIRAGASTYIGLSEIQIRYELAKAKDGQKKFPDALDLYAQIASEAADDSYFQEEATFEIGRLNLILALQSTGERQERLKKAYEEFDLWTARDWTTVITRAWGYYHQACILSIWIDEAPDEASKQKWAAAFSQKKADYAMDVGGFKGEQRRHWEFARYLMRRPNEVYLPGDPVACGLEESFFEAP